MAYRVRQLAGAERRMLAPLAWVLEADDGAEKWPDEPWMYVTGFRDLAAMDEYLRTTKKEVTR